VDAFFAHRGSGRSHSGSADADEMDRFYRKKHGSKELEIEPAEKDEMGREKPL